MIYPFHISLIKHGRRLCRAQRPLCEECPLLEGCPAGQEFVAARHATTDKPRVQRGGAGGTLSVTGPANE
jgi:adenine-specific DNA glycosylase